MGRYNSAAAMLKKAVEVRERILGAEDSDTLSSVSNLAGVLQDQGKYEEAEQMNRQALDGHEKALGKDHPDTLTSISNLAGVLQDQGRISDGSIFLTGSTGNVLLFIKRNGSVYEAPVVVAGAEDQLTLASCTAAVFGRSAGGTISTLFVTTGGAQGAPVNGTVIEPAKVVSVDTSSL
jgi:hypothetical protein